MLKFDWHIEHLSGVLNWETVVVIHWNVRFYLPKLLSQTAWHNVLNNYSGIGKQSDIIKNRPVPQPLACSLQDQNEINITFETL